MKRIIALALVLLASPALAQNTFIAPGNQSVGSTVQMCLNANSQAVPCSSPNSGNAGYPPGATPVTSFGTGTTGGIAAGMANPPAGQYSYLCGFSANSGTATTAITILVQTSNLAINGAWNLNAPATAATATSGNFLTITFSPCVRASATAIGVGITMGALGAGGVSQTVFLWGYNQ